MTPKTLEGIQVAKMKTGQSPGRYWTASLDQADFIGVGTCPIKENCKIRTYRVGQRSRAGNQVLWSLRSLEVHRVLEAYGIVVLARNKHDPEFS